MSSSSPVPARKPREVRHFSRLAKLGKELEDATAALNAAQSEDEKKALYVLRDQAHQRMLAYKSRGKGRGTISPRFGRTRSKYPPHQGVKESARRLLQALPPDQRRAAMAAISHITSGIPAPASLLELA